MLESDDVYLSNVRSLRIGTRAEQRTKGEQLCGSAIAVSLE